MNQSILDEVEAFLAHYDKLEGKEFNPLRTQSSEEAHRELL